MFPVSFALFIAEVKDRKSDLEEEQGAAVTEFLTWSKKGNSRKMTVHLQAVAFQRRTGGIKVTMSI